MARPPSPEPKVHDRLDSWKEIAAHLRRGERTVRRWEQTEGLPVYRHPHQKQATVYAFRSELDVWLENRRDHWEKPDDTAADAGIVASKGRRWLLIATPRFKRLSALLAVLALAGWLLLRPNRESVLLRSPVRLTADTGVNIFPAISRDGRLLVYSSDREGAGDLKLWSHELTDGKAAAGNPIQITRGSGDDITPDFSPDGSWVVFRANREQPGLYMISVFGSEERRLTNSGWQPRFSPDGNWIAYHGFYQGVVKRQGSSLYVIPARGGQPAIVQIRNEVILQDGNPLWTPDGSHLIFTGLDRNGARDLWVVPREGGEALPLGVSSQLRSQGFQELSGEHLSYDWLGDDAVIAIRSHDLANLWRIPILHRTWNAGSPVRRLTFGSATNELSPRTSAAGRVVFSTDFHVTHLSSLRLKNPDSQIEQLTNDSSLRPATYHSTEGFSAGTRVVVFSSQRSGNPDIWAKDLSSGKEWSLAASQSAEERPLLSPNELSVAYTVSSGSYRSIHILDMESRISRKLCGDCGPLYSWIPDSKRILYGLKTGRSIALFALDVTTGERTEWVKSTQFSILSAAISPDSRWAVLVTQDPQGSPSDLWIAPLELGRVSDSAGWLRITQTEPDFPVVWSGLSDRLFYFSNVKDGHHCLWARRWNGTEAGPEEPVRHFHSRRRYPWSSWLALSKDRLVFMLTEGSSNIWTIDAGEPR